MELFEAHKAYSPAEIADRLGVTPAWVRHLCRRGDFKSFKMGGEKSRTRISGEEINEWLKSRSQGTKPVKGE